MQVSSWPNARFFHDTGSPALFLPALKTQSDAPDDSSKVEILLEVQAVNATGDRQRSWFIGDDTVVQGMDPSYNSLM